MRGWLLVMALVLPPVVTACIPEKAPGEMLIVNETDQPLYEMGVRLAPDGGKRFVGVDGCSGDSRLQLTDTTGAVFVALEEPYCEGQTWKVRGSDDYVLESPSDD